ncbi:BQ5605_C018g08670 [Microbotryum silenes-dioicae]|uniref:Signal peptidase complex catalytic subunit SEC11 n=1 Tax=Microbotryum silenes-dioicae TaxID=796604 RepID=A0A2X0LWN6_9BASI|nr:BQ5605_C018g08670 [Microbotryum silenes-dioicae]
MFTDEIATLRRLGFRHVSLTPRTTSMRWAHIELTPLLARSTDELPLVHHCQVLLQALNFATVLSTALMIWKGLGVICNTESPIVVVLSESMEPAIQRGDLLFLTMPRKAPLKLGDITVYKIPGTPIPIVHRVIEVHDHRRNTTEQWILTKGDNNMADDVDLYNGIKYLQRSHIVGKVQGYVPYVGYVTIMMNDFPKLKYALLAILGGAVLLHREG